MGEIYCLVITLIGVVSFLFARGDRFESDPYEAPSTNEWPDLKSIFTDYRDEDYINMKSFKKR